MSEESFEQQIIRSLNEQYHRKNAAKDGLVVPLVVGIAGGVSVGKSTFGKQLKGMLETEGFSTVVISGDSFLMPNNVLDEKGLKERKGFPETYKNEEIHTFLRDIQHLHSTEHAEIKIPIYDHVIYDIRPDEQYSIPKVSIVLFEGINVLQFHENLDYCLYLDANPEDMKNWYLNRWKSFKSEIEKDPSEFFKPFLSMTEEQFEGMLLHYWDNLNLPNLLQYIQPTKVHANIIICKAADHSISSVLYQ